MSVEERAEQLASERRKAAADELRQQQQLYSATLRDKSPAGWLYKRGGRMKTWKKRFCVIEHGILYFYVSDKDKGLGAPALGALVLQNSQTRRPTSMGNKGKFKHTCFRIDLDESVQMKVVAGAASTKDQEEELPDDEDEDAMADARGRVGKSKWLFAAEDGPSVQMWMTALAFWSAQGQELEVRKQQSRKLSEEVLAKIQQEAMHEATELEAAAAAERAAREAARKAELAALPVPPIASIDDMSLADLRQVIEQGGLDATDCVEKDELRARAKEAVEALGGGEEPAAEIEGESSEEEGDEDDDGDETLAQAQAQALAAAQAARAESEGTVDISDPADDDDRSSGVVGSGSGVDSRGGCGGAGTLSAAATTSANEPAEKAELRTWQATALQHQLTAMGVAFAAEAPQETLVELYWEALFKAGKHDDDVARRFLITPPNTDLATLARAWIEGVTGMHFPPEYTDLQALLRSGEVLCDFINCLRPGIVGTITRYAEAAAMPESKRNARMRENVGQYIDACAELGLPQRELFITADLFDNKGFESVLRNIEGLARFCQDGVPGFKGPFIGKRAVAPKKKFNVHTVQVPQVILGGGRGGAYIPSVGGRGM